MTNGGKRRSCLFSHMVLSLVDEQQILRGQDFHFPQATVKARSRDVLGDRSLVATLRMMWNSARAWGYVAHDLFDGLVLPKRGLVHAFTLSLEDTQRIIASSSEPYNTFYSILAETGIRGGEICALRVADLSDRAYGGVRFKR